MVVLLLDRQTTEQVISLLFCDSFSRFQNLSHLLQRGENKTFYTWKNVSTNRAQRSSNIKILMHLDRPLARIQGQWSELTLQGGTVKEPGAVRPVDVAPL